MRLSKKILVLWGMRLIAADFLLIPAADWLFNLNVWGYLLIASVNLLLCGLLYLRYISFLLNTNSFILINSGFLIKKQILIKPCRVFGIKQTQTPLSSVLNLSAAVIYCEGKRYVLPPTDIKALKELTNLIKKAKREANKN